MRVAENGLWRTLERVRATRTLLCTAILLFLTGCQASHEVDLRVLPDASYEARATLRLGEEAAEWGASNLEEAQTKIAAYSGYSVGDIDAEYDDGQAVFKTPLKVSEQSGKATGVSAVSVTDRGDGTLLVRVSLVTPHDLRNALAASVETEQDSAALTSTLWRLYEETVTLRLPGAVRSAVIVADGVETIVGSDGQKVSVTTSLKDAGAAELVVICETKSGGSKLPLVGGAALLLIGALLYDKRRRKTMKGDTA